MKAEVESGVDPGSEGGEVCLSKTDSTRDFLFGAFFLKYPPEI